LISQLVCHIHPQEIGAADIAGEQYISGEDNPWNACRVMQEIAHGAGGVSRRVHRFYQ